MISKYQNIKISNNRHTDTSKGNGWCYQTAPAPFQSPLMGFGSKETETPKSSATLCRRNRANQHWSPLSIPVHGPTWYSHWPLHTQHIYRYTVIWKIFKITKHLDLWRPDALFQCHYSDIGGIMHRYAISSSAFCLEYPNIFKAKIF